MAISIGGSRVSKEQAKKLKERVGFIKRKEKIPTRLKLKGIDDTSLKQITEKIIKKKSSRSSSSSRKRKAAAEEKAKVFARAKTKAEEKVKAKARAKAKVFATAKAKAKALTLEKVLKKSQKKKEITGKKILLTKQRENIKRLVIENEKAVKKSLPIKLKTLQITPQVQKSRLEKIEDSLSQEYFRIVRKSVNQRTQKEMALVSLFGIGSSAIGTVRKIPNVVWETLVLTVRPDIIIKGITKLAVDPGARREVKRQIESLGGNLQRGDPKAVSSVIAQIVGTKGAGKIISETGKIVAVTKPVRIIKEIKFTRSQPKEIRPFVKTILKSARIQEGLTPTKLKGLKKINFNEVKELNKIEAKALKKTLQDTDSFVFGSVSTRTISKGKTKLPKDVDLATKNIKKFQEEFIKNLPQKIRKKYIVGKEFIKKGDTKILDIKDYSRLRPDQTIFGTGRLPISSVVYSSQGKKLLKQAGLKIPTKSLVKIEGVKIVGFGEQTSRKALGTLQVILEKGGRRAKDPAAFVESLEIQLAGLQGKIPKTKFVNKYLLKTKAKDLKNSIKILKSKQFQKLLDKKVPGLTKEFPIINKINKLTPKAKSNILKNVKTKINKFKVKSKVKIKTKIKKSKLPTSKIRPSKIRPSKIRPSKIRPSKIKPSKIRPSKIKPSKIRPSKITPSRIPSRITPSRLPPSRLPPSRLPPSRLPPSRLPPSKDKTKVRKITFNSKKMLKGGSRQGYLVKIKKGNKVLFATSSTLPLKRAKNLARKFTDNTIGASHSLTKKGKTSIKDVKNLILGKKFRAKKSKSKKVQKEVEKRKFRLDKKQEKKGIKIKSIKKKIKKKVIKKKK